MTKTKSLFINAANWLNAQYTNDIKNDSWLVNDIFDNKSCRCLKYVDRFEE